MTDELPESPDRLELFQAIRLLEATRGADPSGTNARDGGPGVRFRGRTGTAFAHADLTGAEPGGDGTPPALTVAGFALQGPDGALPQAYTDALARDLRANNTGLRELFDVFNQHLTELLYEGWAKYRLPVQHERAAGGDDPITRALLALIGVGVPGVRERGAVGDHALLRYGGLLARRVRCADGLAALLRDDTGRPVTVRQFQGRWLPMPVRDRTRLGAAHTRLGDDALAGAAVWDVEGTFRVRVGPLDRATFRAFMPGGGALARLCELTRFYAGPALVFDVQMLLHGAEVPGVTLAPPGSPDAPRLGWNTWLTGEPLPGDLDDAVFPEPAAS